MESDSVFASFFRSGTSCLAVAALVSPLLVACGGGGTDATTPTAPPAPPPPPAATEVAAGQRTQVTLGAAGGSLALSTREGASFTLTVPPGAVPAGTELALETAAPAAGRRLHLRLLPAGLVPAQPLVLTMALPAALALPSGATLVYDRAPVPFARLADGRIELRLRALAGTAAASPASSRQRALAARPLASAPVAACSGVPVLETTPEGGLADTAPIVADDYGSCMLGAVNALALSGQFGEAVRLASAIGAYLQSIGAANTDGLSNRFVDEARSLACTAYGLALDDAAATTVTSFATLSRAVKPVLFWEAAVQRLGAVCPGVPATRYVNVVENLTSDALRFYASRQGAVVDVGSVEYTEAVQEARDGEEAVAQVRSLEPPAPVRALAEAQIQERAQPALVDAVLQAPWQRCRDSGQFDELARLVDSAGELGSVLKAAQYCATQLQALGRLSNGDVAETLSPALGGERAGVNRTRSSLYVPRNGRLELSGAIGTLGCPSGRTGGSEGLSVRIAGVEVRRLTAPYLSTPVFIEMASALQTARVADDAFEAPLTIERVGAPCSGFWGESPAPLLQLDLSFNNDMQITSVTRTHRCTAVLDRSSPNPSNYRYHRSFVFAEPLAGLPAVSSTDCGPVPWFMRSELRRLDARTLQWEHTADYSGGDRYLSGLATSIEVGLKFNRAGRVTITSEVLAGACDASYVSEGATQGNWVRSYSNFTAAAYRDWLLSPCGFPTLPSTVTFDVVAGERGGSNLEALNDFTRDGYASRSRITIRFEPAP